MHIYKINYKNKTDVTENNTKDAILSSSTTTTSTITITTPQTTNDNYQPNPSGFIALATILMFVGVQACGYLCKCHVEVDVNDADSGISSAPESPMPFLGDDANYDF